jgi:hypothetical protein
MQRYGFLNRSVRSKYSVSPFLLDFAMCPLPQLGQSTEQLLGDSDCISLFLRRAEILLRLERRCIGLPGIKLALVKLLACSQAGLAANHRVIDEQNDDCPDYRD